MPLFWVDNDLKFLKRRKLTFSIPLLQLHKKVEIIIFSIGMVLWLVLRFSDLFFANLRTETMGI